MSQENVDIVRRRFEAWRRGDSEGFMESNHPDIELVTDPAWPEPGTYRGDAEVRQFYARYSDSWERVEAVDFELLDADTKVVARFRNLVAGRGSGIEVENQASTVFTLDGGQVTRIEYFFDHDQALAAAGLK